MLPILLIAGIVVLSDCCGTLEVGAGLEAFRTMKFLSPDAAEIGNNDFVEVTSVSGDEMATVDDAGVRSIDVVARMAVSEAVEIDVETALEGNRTMLVFVYVVAFPQTESFGRTGGVVPAFAPRMMSEA